jgi:hypothetical protein
MGTDGQMDKQTDKKTDKYLLNIQGQVLTPSWECGFMILTCYAQLISMARISENQ